MEAIDRLHTTAESHHRALIVEVMGRHAGWIALHAGLAGGANVILIPERPFDIDKVCGYVEHRFQTRYAPIVVVAEGAHPIARRALADVRPARRVRPRPARRRRPVPGPRDREADRQGGPLHGPRPRNRTTGYRWIGWICWCYWYHRPDRNSGSSWSYWSHRIARNDWSDRANSSQECRSYPQWDDNLHSDSWNDNALRRMYCRWRCQRGSQWCWKQRSSSWWWWRWWLFSLEDHKCQCHISHCSGWCWRNCRNGWKQPWERRVRHFIHQSSRARN